MLFLHNYLSCPCRKHRVDGGLYLGHGIHYHRSVIMSPSKSSTYGRKTLSWRMESPSHNGTKTPNFFGSMFSKLYKLGNELMGKKEAVSTESLHEGYLSSLDFEEQEDDRWILSSRIVCKPQSLQSARQIIRKFVQESRGKEFPKRLVSISCHEDPDNPGVFMLIEVFQTQLAMVEYQKESLYQSFLRQLQPLMEEPLGVHLSKERKGKILSSFYPYGPGGEGGRDDMVYR
jgi:quinol monooxygenase YgiN